jgi:hypothetical protein
VGRFRKNVGCFGGNFFESFDSTAIDILQTKLDVPIEK